MRPPRRPKMTYEVPEVEVDPDSLITLRTIGELYGMSYGTVRDLAEESARARRAGRTTTAHLPPPDRYVGESPVWHLVDLDAWHLSRPGKGAPWSGRPRGSRDKVKRKRRVDAGQPRDPRVWGSKARAKRAAA